MIQLIKNLSLSCLKQRLVLYIMSLFILISPFSFSMAGFDKGNGGDGFNCSAPEDSFFLAEEIESLPMWGIKTLKVLKNDQKITTFKAIQKLANLYPNFTQILEKDLLWTESNLKLINNVDLVDLDDDLLAWIPNNCDLVQVALQTQSDVFVVQLYWNKMNILKQAMLLTHEAIYRSLVRLAKKQNIKLQNSIGVRLINAYIWQEDASEFYKPMSFDQLKQALAKLQLPNLHAP